ncbi:cytochrome P450 [Nitrobacter sp.]|uniref:cytochrome P450 n=1 Tax=Nitrobacter sp. TaxID=29420 RepID=UPI0029CABDBD|nr:cytochrome P450 [Nitrobacter sp.]
MKDPLYNPVVPDHVPAQLVHDFHIFDFDGDDPYLSIRNLLERGLPDIIWSRNNGGHWVILGGHVVADIMRDNVHFSASRPVVPDSENLETTRFLPVMTDPPEHTLYRGLIAPLLTPKFVNALQAQIRELTELLIDDVLERAEFDFMADFAAKMPIIVFMRFLGLPESDRAKLLDLANRVVEPNEGEHRDAPMAELLDYIGPIIEACRANPGEDLISLLLRRQEKGEWLSDTDMLWLTTSVMLAGLETVSASLGYSARFLAENLDARRRLIAEPDLIPNAVEEILRRYPPSTPGRILIEDTEIHGVHMKKGEHVIWSLGMFNFDERIFPDAMTVNLDRERSQHATFGIGIHFCVGAFLARTELRIFLEHWLRRVPDFHIPEGAAIDWRIGLTTSLKNLPLALGSKPGEMVDVPRSKAA